MIELSASTRFRDQTIVFKNNAVGENVEIASASPINFYQVINQPDNLPTITIDGKLFLPQSAEPPYPLVIVVPGSLGVAPSHLAHAETLNELNVATFVLDSFGARSVSSTVADQTQFSFAASAYDVLAAYRELSRLPAIDSKRIGAQGHSRGGSAVLQAATRRFADAVVGPEQNLIGVLAAYPWSGQQFLDPRIGQTQVSVLIGDRDEWCSVSQVQGHCQAIHLCGGNVNLRIVAGAQHSFDRDTPIEEVSEASVARAAPIVYIADDGAMVDPESGEPNPLLVDRDTMVYMLKAGYGEKGARIGSSPGEAALFRNDMIDFWTNVLL